VSDPSRQPSQSRLPLRFPPHRAALRSAAQRSAAVLSIFTYRSLSALFDEFRQVVGKHISRQRDTYYPA
jgi:hypothetical protein